MTIVKRLLEAFHEEVEKRAIRNGASIAQFMMLKHNLSGYLEIVKDAAENSKNEIASKQKDVNREFVPVVTAFMQPAYTYCTQESGPGSFKRMKTHMASHIDARKGEMFAKSVEAVRNEITKMLRAAGETLETSVDEVFMPLKRDYIQQVTGVSAAQTERLPREQRRMRKDVQDLVNGAAKRFERVLGLASPSPEPESASENIDNPAATVKTEAETADLTSSNESHIDKQDASTDPAETDREDNNAPLSVSAESQLPPQSTHHIQVKPDPDTETTPLTDVSETPGGARYAEATSSSGLTASHGNTSSIAEHNSATHLSKTATQRSIDHRCWSSMID